MPDNSPHPALAPRRTAWHRTGRWAAAFAAISFALGWVLLRADIPPPVIDDNAYTFLAADQLHDGHGLTTIPPLAPRQPWYWQGDWTVLTQWPPGYPVLLCIVRWMTGLGTLNAARLMAVIACAAALVGWFIWTRRVVAAAPRLQPGRSASPAAARRVGVTASLLATLAALAAVGAPQLINPSSDTLLVAAVPWTLLLALHLDRAAGRNLAGFGILGLLCGALVWIRYAALFLPLAVGVYLALRWAGRRRRLADVTAYAIGVAIPLAGIVIFNQSAARDATVTAQFNLGSEIGADFTPEYLLYAWRHFSDQTLYAHHRASESFFAWGLPLLALTVPLVTRRNRRRWLAWIKSPGVLLSLSATITLLVFLILATTLFSEKFNYVGLARYYQPIRPLYFVVLVGSLLCCRHPLMRAALCIGLLGGCSWFVRQDATRDLQRWQAANRATTDYGRWAVRFEPNSRLLYSWIRDEATHRWVLFSNFHDDIALETQVPACPLPRDRHEMEAWLAAVRQERGQPDLEVLFVLDPENHHRNYYLPPPADVIATFDLQRLEHAPAPIRGYVFTPAGYRLAAVPP